MKTHKNLHCPKKSIKLYNTSTPNLYFPTSSIHQPLIPISHYQPFSPNSKKHKQKHHLSSKPTSIISNFNSKYPHPTDYSFPTSYLNQISLFAPTSSNKSEFINPTIDILEKQHIYIEYITKQRTIDLREDPYFIENINKQKAIELINLNQQNKRNETMKEQIMQGIEVHSIIPPRKPQSNKIVNLILYNSIFGKLDTSNYVTEVVMEYEEKLMLNKFDKETWFKTPIEDI